MMSQQPRYLTANEAADILGITLPTLYAYVSRGLIRSETLDQRKRTKRYWAEDVEKLRSRNEQRRDPSKAVAGALHWGTPLLDSAITLIADGQYYYRGYNAVSLAQSHTVEQVATLIWSGTLYADTSALFEDASGELPSRCNAVRSHLADLSPMEAFQALLPLIAVDDYGAYIVQPERVAHTGAQLLRMMTSIACHSDSAPAGVAETLQQHWAPSDPTAVDFLRMALILCADHELNVSSFTARCVASARATPYQAVMAGLAALQGARHGRETSRFEAFLREVDHPQEVERTIVERLQRGEPPPACGHPLYPEGDPRGRLLIDKVREMYPDAPVVELITTIEQVVWRTMGVHLTLDAGLVAVSRALRLPRGSAITLFALGRTIGWIGQAIEQYGVEAMIRPRARYVGEQPPR